jgi:protein TonB
MLPVRVIRIVCVALVAGTSAIAATQELPPSTAQGWQIAGAFLQSESGPLERSAKPITRENPIPGRTRLVRPPYPPEAASVGARATVTLRVTVDHLGTVGEVRTIGVPVLGAMAPGTARDETAFAAGLMALVRTAKDAVGQWLYDPPADAPIAFDVVIGFTSDGNGEVIAQSGGSRLEPAASAPLESAIRPGGDIRPPKKVKHVNPVYPVAAREAKIAGVVIVEARVEADGRILEARILRSIPELDAAALDAVKQWEFEPLRLSGVPTPTTMTLTVQFSLP